MSPAPQMLAITARDYGSPDVLRIEQVDKPVPASNELLIRVHAATVSTTDNTARSGKPFFSRLAFGLRRPKTPILGTEFAGTVEALGQDVTRFSVGDQVVAASATGFGAHAEYIALPEDGAIAIKSPSLSFQEAAAIAEGALTALPFLRDIGRVKPGQKVLINGASGAVGTSAVQLARALGAEVTGVSSTRHLDLVRSLGTDRVIDYTVEDFTTGGETWDVIFDAAGKSSYRRSRKALRPGGIYMTTVPSLAIFPQMLWTKVRGGNRAAIAFTGLRKPAARARDLAHIAELAETGKLKPVISGRFPFGQAVDAHKQVAAGSKHGSVVITMVEDNSEAKNSPPLRTNGAPDALRPVAAAGD